MPVDAPAKKKKGFTLIELVVVIVVIGILAAIAVVGYGSLTQRSTREVAERSADIVSREAIALAAFDNTPANASHYQTVVDEDASSNVTFDGTDTLTISVAGESCTVTFTDLAAGDHGSAVCSGSSPTTTAPAPPSALSLSGTVTTVASGIPSQMRGISTDGSGNVYFTSNGGPAAYKVNSSGTLTTLASGSGVVGWPGGIAIDSSGVAWVPFTQGAPGNQFLRINPDSSTNYLSEPGIPTDLSYSTLAFAPDNTLYVSEFNGNRIWKRTPAGVWSVLAGSGAIGAADGTGTNASFYRPVGISLSSSGTLLVGDEYNNKIRAIDTATGAVTTVNTTGISCPASAVQDTDGTIYISDVCDGRLYKNVAGTVTQVSLSGSSLSGAYHMTIANNSLYVLDISGGRVLKVS